MKINAGTWGFYHKLSWMGYSNSAINPFLYAMFMPEFRQAFKEILLFRCFSMNDRIRRNNYSNQIGQQHFSNSRNSIYYIAKRDVYQAWTWIVYGFNVIFNFKWCWWLIVLATHIHIKTLERFYLLKMRSISHNMSHHHSAWVVIELEPLKSHC